jgi:hypothetical protein
LPVCLSALSFEVYDSEDALLVLPGLRMFQKRRLVLNCGDGRLGKTGKLQAPVTGQSRGGLTSDEWKVARITPPM